MPYRFYFIEDYSEDECFLFLIFNHAFVDGLNLTAAMAILSDDNNHLENLSKVKGVSILNKILGIILLPYLFLKVSFNSIMIPEAKNCIK